MNRRDGWKKFDQLVRLHIVKYTEEQYGNPEGNEQVDSFTIEDCWQNMQRYYNRRKSNTRGNKEKLRDLIKVAHYAQLTYDKLKKELGEGDVY